MFDFVAKYKFIIQIMLALIMVPFAFFGLESYTRSAGGTDTVANVAGRKITQREFNDELRQQMDRLRGVFGRNFDTAMFDTPAVRLELLDGMINREVLNGAVRDANLTINDEQLRELIASQPSFQVNGQFNKDQYKALLASQNMTEQQFESRLRFDLAMSQLNRAVGGSVIQARAVSDRLAAIENEKREVSEVAIAGQTLAGQVSIDQAMIQTYYDANLKQFQSPEQVKAEYVLLSADQLGALEPATEAEIKAAYESRAAQYRQEEQRRASHILIPVAADASAEGKAAARKQAETVLAELKRTPNRFAELAKQHSKDPGSAEKGGDLGFFSRGMLVKGFEDAAFGLREGETSGVVSSEFGFHIIRVTTIRAGKTKALDEVRAELAKEITRQKGMKKFAEAAEVFSNTVYEQSDSLKPVADRFKLTIQRTDWMSQVATPAAGPLAHPNLMRALFSTDATQAKRNTDAVEVAPSTLVAARVIEYRPAAQRKLEEVSAEIDVLLRRQQAAKLAHADGAARLAKLQAGQPDATLKWSAGRAFTRRGAGNLPPETVRAILSADPAKLPAYVGAEAEGGYVIYRVNKVIAPEAQDEKQQKAMRARLDGQAGGAQYDAYVAALRAQSKVVINTENLEKRQP